MSDAPELVRAESLKPGEAVTVTFEAVVREVGSLGVSVKTGKGIEAQVHHLPAEAEIRRLPPKGRPVDRGCIVSDAAQLAYVVKGIDWPYLWCRVREGENHATFHFSRLTHTDGTPITDPTNQ